MGCWIKFEIRGNFGSDIRYRWFDYADDEFSEDVVHFADHEISEEWGIHSYSVDYEKVEKPPKETCEKMTEHLRSKIKNAEEMIEKLKTD